MDYDPDKSNGPAESKLATENVVFRDQSQRYPWWVKSVDKITTEIDESVMERPRGTIIKWLMKQPPEDLIKLITSGKNKYTNRVQNEEAGTRLRDVALHQAATSFWWIGGKMNNEMAAGSMTDLLDMAREKMSVSPGDFDVDPWKGSPEQASSMVEAAGIFLGAAQIGFTSINENWLPPNIVFDSSVDSITPGDENRILYPDRFKYVITGAALVPNAAGMRSPSAIGNAADRLGFEHALLAASRMVVFLNSLGYGAEYVPSFNPVPWAVASGLGEMGRMNRMISPLYGGALRLFSIITDLPLALDKPIDFGLQEFCRHCRKCAEACPSGALSMEKEPSWEWEGDQFWHYKGKKVWWEDSRKCQVYQLNERCINCMMSCPWTKDNKTVLHEIAHVMASRFPRLGWLLRKMDDLFGYNLVDKTDSKMNDWWDFHDPISGIDSNRSRR
ncbi:MAG: reductive dehalogenase [Proteobacteria bacterium]|nr:reductive dehalogenase [Pseudomonadota bacterium]